MIKDNQRFFNRIRLFIDALITAGTYLLAWYIKFVSVFAVDDEIGRLPNEIYLGALWAIVPGYIFLYYYFKTYTPKRGLKFADEVSGIIKTNIAGAAIFIIVLYIINQPDFSRSMIFMFAGFNTVCAMIGHYVVKQVLNVLRRKGYNNKYVLLVGYSRTTEEYINRILANPQWGYVVRGILDDEIPVGTTYKGVKVLGHIANLNMILEQSDLDEIAITIALKDYVNLEKIVDKCEKSGVHTKFIPDYMSIIPSMPYTEDIQGLSAINIRYVPLSNTFNQIMKRAIDIVGSVIGIIITSPIMFVCAILVRCSSEGPIIFKQERVGLHNKSFNMYKFRSMRIQSEADEKKGWTTKDDPRITKVGAVLRKTSLDELPQLFNILKGDMSLVGPRPERPQFVEQFKEEIPRYMIKHQVRPGLTGWAQVNGYRGDTSIYKRIEYDLFYIENWTLWMDFRIIFRTFFVGFVNKNAY
ncbi:MAG: undecaprenyl-phosphate glucose phosphotransferase [Lachnospiraceae bacterium]|nr:undecaprenyl-phosphate glucose phosphotransferase [Lachnospiraceae bacterium]